MKAAPNDQDTTAKRAPEADPAQDTSSISEEELAELMAWCTSDQEAPQFRAAQALADLSAHSANQVRIVEAGGVEKLLQLAEGERDPEIQLRAVRALANLGLADENH